MCVGSRLFTLPPETTFPPFLFLEGKNELTPRRLAALWFLWRRLPKFLENPDYCFYWCYLASRF